MKPLRQPFPKPDVRGVICSLVGSSIKFLVSLLLLLNTIAHAAKVNIIENAANDADGSMIGAVSVDQFIDIGTTYTTTTAPTTYASYRFTHWTFSGEPTTVYRDAWGRSQNPISFLVQVAATATAHYLPENDDTDGDTVPDWYEMEYYGDLTHNASYDSDGDGITLLAEYTGGSSPLYANSTLEGGVAWADSALVTCNLAGYPTYILRSVPAGTVNQTGTVAPGTVVNVPDLSGNASFGYWTLDGVRQDDPWGRALSTFSFTIASVDREAVAYLFTGDSDGDSVPDAYEQRYFGTLANNEASDTDGDGITLLAEYTGGTSPIYGNTVQEGGVAWADSALITCNLAGYPAYTVRSVPAGTVNQTGFAAPGTVLTVPDLASDSSFGYWTLDGVRQNDAWGRALSIFSFTMASADREAVAYLFTGDSDGDSVPDAYEQRYFGTLSNNGSSDTDGDGITLLAEYTAGTSPIYGNTLQEGGVAWADSGLVTADLQAEITVEQPLGFDIPNGGTGGFGNVRVGKSKSLIFTIKNVGGTPLTGLTITKDGLDAAEFTVTTSPTAPVLHNESTSFTVQFAPLNLGAKTAALHIASNDANENPFDIALTGTGTPYPIEFTLDGVDGDVVTGSGAPDALGGSDGTAFDLLTRGGFIAENGHLAFPGELTGPGVDGTNFKAFWKDDGTLLKRLVRTGDDAPETGATAAKFSDLSLIPGINDEGQVTLLAALATNPSSTPPTTIDNDTGLWSELGGTGFQILMREGDDIPGLPPGTQVGRFGSGCFATAKISATEGEAAFAITMKGASTDTALLRCSVVNSDTTAVGVVARENTSAPGTGENFGFLNSSFTDAVRMDAQGNLVFGALLKITGRTSLWYQPRGGALVTAMVAGNPAPGTTGATFQSLDVPSMGSAGTFAFRGVLDRDGDNADNSKNDGIWRGSVAGGFTNILRRGDDNTTRPGLNLPSGTAKAGNIWSGWLTNANHGAWLGWVDLGGNGISPYPYDGNFTASTDTFGIYTDLSGTMALLISSGDPAPGIAGATLFFVDHPVVSGTAPTEHLAFVATVTGGGTTAANNKGIWRSLNGAAPTLVLRTGDAMTVTPGGAKTIADIDLPGSGDASHTWETPVMDANGRLLVFVTFDDGTTTQVIVP